MAVRQGKETRGEKKGEEKQNKWIFFILLICEMKISYLTPIMFILIPRLWSFMLSPLWLLREYLCSRDCMVNLFGEKSLHVVSRWFLHFRFLIVILIWNLITSSVILVVICVILLIDAIHILWSFSIDIIRKKTACFATENLKLMTIWDVTMLCCLKLKHG